MKKTAFRKNFIASVFVVSFLLSTCCPVSVCAVTKGDIDAVKAMRDEVAAEKQAQQKVLDKLSADRDGIVAQKLALEEHVSLTQQQILLNEEEIALYDEMISDKQLEVDAAKKQEDRQLYLYRSRVRAMEENGILDILDLLFSAESLPALLAAIDDAGEIMESDKRLEDALIAARKEHERIQKEYEEYKAGIISKQEILRDEENQLNIEIFSAQEKINVLQEEINSNQELLDEIESRWSELDSELSSLQEKYNAEHAAAPGSLSGSGFIWPCGTTYITSRAGNRVHPITGDYRYHSGMDVGCGYGDSVWAASSGTVTVAGWNGNYGNCVMIDHGNGYQTLYGHLSAVGVYVGKSVSQGEGIGNVGSTGLATGPHLHFEIRSGGACLDPESFFGSGSFQFSPDCGN